MKKITLMKNSFLLICLLVLLSVFFKDKNKTMTTDEPKTGYEKTIKFIVGDVKLDIPYGYLFDYTKKKGKLWFSEEQERHRMQGLNIAMVQSEEPEPYNEKNKHHFLNYLKGKKSDTISVLIKAKDKSNLNLENSIKNKLGFGYHKVSLDNPHYTAYEAKNPSTASPYEISFYRNDDEKTVINLSKKILPHKNGKETKKISKYKVQVFSNYYDVATHYYLNYQTSQPPSLEELSAINDKIKKLIKTMIVK